MRQLFSPWVWADITWSEGVSDAISAFISSSERRPLSPALAFSAPARIDGYT
jgi:hypothetical protein